jgi:hypothetical protein
MKAFFVIITIFAYFLASCKGEENSEPAGPGGWLDGNEQEKFNTIAGQLRGFDMAMVETGTAIRNFIGQVRMRIGNMRTIN